MSITRFIRKVSTQPAVYWEFDGLDQFTNPQFKEPVQIFVRWDEKTEIVSGIDGKEFMSRAQVLTPLDLVEQSYLYLGTLDDLPNEPKARETEGAFEIKKMDRHPLFRSRTLDVFIAYL